MPPRSRRRYVPAVQRMEPSLPGRADDGRSVGPSHPPLPHFRDEWRKLSLSRVDEHEEGPKVGATPTLSALSKPAIFRSQGGQNDAPTGGQKFALSSKIKLDFRPGRSYGHGGGSAEGLLSGSPDCFTSFLMRGQNRTGRRRSRCRNSRIRPHRDSPALDTVIG